MAGRMVVGSAALADLVRPASAPDPVGGHRVLPVVPELTGLLPNRGLRRAAPSRSPPASPAAVVAPH